MRIPFFIAALIAGAPVAFAHHSFAMFDDTVTREMTGVVTELRWTNPHAWLFIDVADEDGRATQWAFEMSAPSGLVRSGWAPRSVRPGDEVTVTMHPLRDGNPAGQLLSLTLPNGETLGDPSIGGR